MKRNNCDILPHLNYHALNVYEKTATSANAMTSWNNAYNMTQSLSAQPVRMGIYSIPCGGTYARLMNQKQYELKDHLGNVRVTFSDLKQPQDCDLLADGYVATAMSVNNYYSFGMLQPGRNWSVGNYRFGFNGKENDNEVKGTGNSVDFGARIYDSRLGRWLSVDPLQIKYPGLSTYQFCANTPISAMDPDGRVIIFINGLWGSPTGAEGGGTAEYWGSGWIQRTQNAIGDHSQPRFYDGSMGGTSAFGLNTSMSNRMLIGKATGYSDAKTIIDNLSAGETIKIVTNSMGTAFERGFTDGLYQYIDERMTQISSELGSLTMQKNILAQGLDKGRLNALNLLADPTAAEKQLMGINSKMSALEAEKKKLENVEVEMVIDLSSHQVDFPDNNATCNYYMVAAPNTKHWAEQLFVNEKEIGGGSQPLGFMRGHAGSLANPSSFPSAKKRDD